MKKLDLNQPATEQRHPERVSVLLVDDNTANLQALEETLSSLGENLVSVMSGKEALKKLLEEEFAVILLDVNMPEMDGYETAALIRGHEKTRSLPIMFVTAYDKGEPFILEGYSIGAVDYILKPYNPEILKSKVSVYVDLFRMREELRSAKELEIATNKQVFETKHKKTTDELAESRAQLIREEKLSAMGKLAALVGHEMRGPLGVIKNSASFIGLRLIETPDEKVTKHLRIIDEEIDRSESIISNILGFARSSIIRPSLRSVNDLIIRAFVDVALPENIKIQTNFDETLPKVSLDAELMDRVFHNVMQNAIQAMPEGGVLTVSSVLDQAQNRVAVLFEDTGCGISEENISKVFEALFTTKSTGTGLGLSACENIVLAHDGTITVDSVEGSGSTFKISLPIEGVKEGES